ncbi:MAG: hypothetical protein K6T65_06730 [Peptococcaceae bacterium]|nr:hypothetical protein [Peptococcaceae bacterium]
MLEEKVKNALVELLNNPFKKTKDLLPNFEDRLKLYSLPAFEYVVMARREGKKAVSRVKIQISKSASIRAMVREKKRIEEEIAIIPPHEKIPVRTDQVVNADIKQGGKSISYYDAELQALGNDEKYVCLMHNLLLVKDYIFDLYKQAISGVLETVSADYRRLAAVYVREKFGYAPGQKFMEVPRKEEKKRYREVNIFTHDINDIHVCSKAEELMQPGGQCQAGARGWLKLSQAGFINPGTGRLGCSFA